MLVNTQMSTQRFQVDNPDPNFLAASGKDVELNKMNAELSGKVVLGSIYHPRRHCVTPIWSSPTIDTIIMDNQWSTTTFVE
jgi:hypothetical protein